MYEVQNAKDAEGNTVEVSFPSTSVPSHSPETVTVTLEAVDYQIV